MADKIPKELQDKIQQLQLMQQQLQMFSAQKQQFQLQQTEVENAQEELKNAKSKTYKLVGEILVEKTKTELGKELEDKRKRLDLRVRAIEKQEKSIHERAMELQEKLTKKLK
tara:strand:+ start:167 stop:502 length:336 start_codon:yes stop_codon:yes gene_type:complete